MGVILQDPASDVPFAVDEDAYAVLVLLVRIDSTSPSEAQFEVKACLEPVPETTTAAQTTQPTTGPAGSTGGPTTSGPAGSTVTEGPVTEITVGVTTTGPATTEKPEPTTPGIATETTSHVCITRDGKH